MPHYDEEYKGHSISIDTYEVGKGWRADYQVDGGQLRQGSNRPLAEAIVRSEALTSAKQEIDKMP